MEITFARLHMHARYMCYGKKRRVSVCVSMINDQKLAHSPIFAFELHAICAHKCDAKTELKNPPRCDFETVMVT